MGLLERDRSVVLAIDLQGKLMEMIHRPELVVSATRRLLRLADLFAVPVVLTEQYPRGLGPTHPELLADFERLAVERRRVEKGGFSCCGEPGFEQALAELQPGSSRGRLQVVIAGIEAHVCVLQTVLGLIEQGVDCHLCWECVSGRGAEYRQWALARMQQAGAAITNHESVGFEWARTKDHPRFKEMSQLFKGGQLV
ncbi:MAG TPA: isochorismatase family protein [Thermoanaerobaculia bacterium]|nr:isochorismatase family protein [Thermoanaerobaculia bacterium]